MIRCGAVMLTDVLPDHDHALARRETPHVDGWAMDEPVIASSSRDHDCTVASFYFPFFFAPSRWLRA